jgi:hypothetical protein
VEMGKLLVYVEDINHSNNSLVIIACVVSSELFYLKHVCEFS